MFSKFLHEIQVAAICLVMERGRRKSQQNSRICVRAQVKLVYQVWNLSDSSKSLDDRQIKGTWRCRQSRFLFPDLSRKDRSDSASRISPRRLLSLNQFWIKSKPFKLWLRNSTNFPKFFLGMGFYHYGFAFSVMSTHYLLYWNVSILYSWLLSTNHCKHDNDVKKGFLLVVIDHL